MRIYQHTQVGTLTLAILAIVAFFALWLRTEMVPDWPAVAVAGSMVLVGLVFGTLRVSVTRRTVQCSMGIGLIRKSIPVSEITSVERVRNKWYYGWGIRYTPTGWMWNVSGLDAVLVHLSNGKAFRIGTDEPGKLEAAIRDTMMEPGSLS